MHSEHLSCGVVGRLLDAYVNDELLVETNAAILEHLDSCKECTASMDSGARLRATVKRAVERQPAPVNLQNDIRSALSLASPAGARRQWAVAAVALLVLALGGAGLWHWQRQGAPTQSADASRTLGMALDVHRFCPADPGLDSLGTGYSGLVELIGEEMPSDYGIAAAHRCLLNGRLFVHVILESGDTRVSFVVTEKAREQLSKEPGMTSDAAGVPVHSTTFGGYQIAGFETRRHLAFVVSDLPRDANLKLASSIATLYAPSVRSTLKEAANAY